MDSPSLARALDALIDDLRRAGPAARRRATDARAFDVDGKDDGAAGATLDALAELAAALDDLPNPPAPDAAFRASLAQQLASAPAPSTVPAIAAPVASPLAAAVSSTATASTATASTATASTARSVTATSSTPAAAEPASVLSTAQLSQAFDTSLVALAAGMPREDALALLGEAAGDGDLTDLVGLAATLYELPDAPSPRAAFRTQLRDALAAAPEPRSLRQAVRPTIWSRLGLRVWQSTKVMAGMAAAFILFAGAGVTFASANALPGDALYPVKRTSERAQLWLGGEADALRHHLAFADRRLDEAIARPPLAGLTLAEFNREVTAALAAADESVARQVPREVVIDPLLRWLLGARSDLIVGRPVLPPMAWRGARALVDEAILALDGGRPLAERAVPRLAQPDAVLALRAESGQPWAHRLPTTTEPAGSPAVADVRLRRAGADDDAIRRTPRDAGASGDVGAADRDAAALVASSRAADPNAGSTTDVGSTGADKPRGSDPRNGDPGKSDPRPTSRPTRSSPTAEPTRDVPTEPPATREPSPTDPSPTEPLPTDPPSVPASPTAVAPTAVAPTSVAPTAAPTEVPTAQPALPAELTLACGKGDSVVEVYQTVLCTLVLPDGWTMPQGWDILWATTSFNPPEDPELVQDDAEPWIARFTPKVALAGSLKMLVNLDATVRDADGRPQAAGEAQLFVVPRNHGTDHASEVQR